jgi:hypothetical protein
MVLLSISPAQAVLVVDTDTPPNTPIGLVMDATQWVAGQFTLTDAYNINSVEGWFGSPNEGTAHATIYGDNGGGLPFGAALHTQQFVLDAPLGITGAWDGAYGQVNWGLEAGTYWLAFEVLEGDTANNFMPDGVPLPLALIAVDSNPTGTGYDVSLDLSYDTTPSFRIDATPSAIPIPSALWLFGTSILGLIGFSKRKATMLKAA